MKTFAKFVTNNIEGIVGIALIAVGLFDIITQSPRRDSAIILIIIGLGTTYDQLKKIADSTDDN